MCVLYEYCCVIVEALLSETYMYKGTRGTLGKTQASLLLTGTREDDLMSLHQNRDGRCRSGVVAETAARAGPV